MYTLIADGTYPPNLSATTNAQGLTFYTSPGAPITAPPWVPTPGFTGGWAFASYNSAGVDYMGDCADNLLTVMTIGPGTIVVHTATYSGSARTWNAQLQHLNGVTVVTDALVTGVSTGSDITFAVPNDGFCIHQVNLEQDAGGCGGKLGYSGFTWTGA